MTFSSSFCFDCFFSMFLQQTNKRTKIQIEWISSFCFVFIPPKKKIQKKHSWENLKENNHSWPKILANIKCEKYTQWEREREYLYSHHSSSFFIHSFIVVYDNHYSFCNKIDKLKVFSSSSSSFSIFWLIVFSSSSSFLINQNNILYDNPEFFYYYDFLRLRFLMFFFFVVVGFRYFIIVLHLHLNLFSFFVCLFEFFDQKQQQQKTFYDDHHEMIFEKKTHNKHRILFDYTNFFLLLLLLEFD